MLVTLVLGSLLNAEALRCWQRRAVLSGGLGLALPVPTFASRYGEGY